jgi:hypothetical protein
MKNVTILLTKFTDVFGKFVSWYSHGGYTHASISIDEDEEIFYSFNYKGFVVEKPNKKTPKKRKPENVIIRMQVPDEVYRMIKEEIDSFLENRANYGYSRLGVVLCFLHIPYKFKNRYFCSQFVAEILEHAGAVRLKKKNTLYLPNQLLDGMECLFPGKKVLYGSFAVA